MTTADHFSRLLKRGTLVPAQRRRVVLENSECGRAAQCSLVSGPLCPCPAGSSPPPPLRTAPRLGFVPSSLQSSGPGSSSCCVLAAGPRRGVWPGTTQAVVWRSSPHLSASLTLHPSPVSSAWLEATEWVGHWLETDRGESVLELKYFFRLCIHAYFPYPSFELLTIVVGGVFLSS